VKPNLNSIISSIIANVSLVGNTTSLVSDHAMVDFTILKIFKINIHHPTLSLYFVELVIECAQARQ
jgi:hypothetical protein